MYEAYFGLKEAPFRLTPDPTYLYMSDRHREALAHLLYGVSEGGGFVQLTGDIGTGKTTLCRALLAQLPPQVDVALILNPRLTDLELLAAVCDELRVPYPPDATSPKVFVDALYGYLLDAHARGRRTVLILDEAQDLSVEVLEQVRLLTNLETTTEKLLQIILIGQPELLKTLARGDLRQLAQRVTARYHLEPFTEADTSAYVRYRLQVAGRSQGLFSEAAIRRIHTESRGIPRLINIICDRALMGAYAQDKSHIESRMVARAAAEIRGRRTHARSVASRRWVTTVALVAAAVVGAMVLAPEQLARRLGFRSLSAVSIGAPAPPTALAHVLADPAIRADEASAFAALYARWGLDQAAAKGEQVCEGGRDDGLRCLARTGSWNKLRRYDLPAVLELVAPTQMRRYVLVTGLGEQTISLEIGGRPFTFPLSEVDRWWDGVFIVVWRPPALTDVPIAPGMRSKDVEWLRGLLGAVDGVSDRAKDRPLYDSALKERVIGFQRSRGVDPDGLVGEETLVQLMVAAHELGVPRLSQGTP
ncbi:MAG TPA: AAA family ATPase [Methylomirabilota bacterium]|nr:AAA family ATPase [Methylomirabilota bacterium]